EGSRAGPVRWRVLPRSPTPAPRFPASACATVLGASTTIAGSSSRSSPCSARVARCSAAIFRSTAYADRSTRSFQALSGSPHAIRRRNRRGSSAKQRAKSIAQTKMRGRRPKPAEHSAAVWITLVTLGDFACPFLHDRACDFSRTVARLGPDDLGSGFFPHKSLTRSSGLLTGLTKATSAREYGWS